MHCLCGAYSDRSMTLSPISGMNITSLISTFLRHLLQNPSIEHQVMVTKMVTNFIFLGDLPCTASSLMVCLHCISTTSSLMKCQHYSLLPKIHGQCNPGRPIAPALGSTECISPYLDSILFPLIQSLSTYLCETSNALHLPIPKFQANEQPTSLHLCHISGSEGTLVPP